MKKINRRQFLQSAGVAAGAAALAACGSASSTTSTATSTATDTASSDSGEVSCIPAAVAAAAEKGETVKIVTYLGSSTNPEKHAIMQAVIGMDKYKDVEIVQNDADELYLDKIPTYIAGGQQVDVFQVQNPLFNMQYAQAGMSVPLDDYLAQYGVDATDEYGENYVDYLTVDGAVHQIPLNVHSWGLYYNRSIFDAAGEPYPDDKIPMTWDDYREVAKRISTGSGATKIFGSFYLYWDGWLTCSATSTNGGGTAFYTDDGMCGIQKPEYAECLQRYYDMMHVDESMLSHAAYTAANTALTEYLTGKYGMQFVGDWGIEWMINTTDYPRDYEIGVAPLPVDAGTDLKTWGAIEGYGVSPTAKHPDVAVEFLVDLNRYYAENTLITNGVNAHIASDKVYTGDELVLETDNVSNEQLKYVFANSDATFLGEKVMGPASSDYSLIFLEEAEIYLVKEQDLTTTIDNIETRVNEAIMAELADA